MTKINNLIKEKNIRRGKKEKMSSILESLRNEPSTLLQWDKRIWILLVEKAIIHKDKTITFKFYCGAEAHSLSIDKKTPI